MVVILALTSCGRPDNETLKPNNPTTTAPSAVPTAQPSATAVLTGLELDATKIANQQQQEHDIATVTAGGELPTPVETPNPTMAAQLTAIAQGVFPTPAPLPTPELGISGDCAQASPEFIYGGCWNGKIDGGYIRVQSGALPTNPDQGVLRIFTSTLDLRDHGPFQVYPTPAKAGLVDIAQVAWPRITLVTLNDDSPVNRFVFNAATRTWDTSAACDLYPLALHSSTVTGLQMRDQIPDILNGAGKGNFGWLNWNGDQANNGLVQSLIPPGTSATYTNPINPTDHVLSVGDDVRGRPGVKNSTDVRQALDGLVQQGDLIVVPIWDQASGQGNNLRYHIAGFAWVRLSGYQLPGQSRISAQYFGKALCDGEQ